MLPARSCAGRLHHLKFFDVKQACRSRTRVFAEKAVCRLSYNFNKFAEPYPFHILQFSGQTLKHHTPAKPKHYPPFGTSSNHTNH